MDDNLEEVASSSSPPMIGVPENPTVLLEQYKNADLPGFALGIEYLGAKYKYMMKVRGDGNCFYRAFLFAYLDQLLVLKNDNSDPNNATKAESERLRFLSCIVGSKELLIALGYSEIAFEAFYDMFVELIEDLFARTRDKLFKDFQEENGDSNYYTWYMRLLTAASMKADPERYLPFLDTPDIAKHCEKEVEPMNRECEAPHIYALTAHLGVTILIEYLDGRNFDSVKGLAVAIFPDSSAVTSETGVVQVTLLYRPGHYDILII